MKWQPAAVETGGGASLGSSTEGARKRIRETQSGRRRLTRKCAGVLRKQSLFVCGSRWRLTRKVLGSSTEASFFAGALDSEGPRKGGVSTRLYPRSTIPLYSEGSRKPLGSKCFFSVHKGAWLGRFAEACRKQCNSQTRLTRKDLGRLSEANELSQCSLKGVF